MSKSKKSYDNRNIPTKIAFQQAAGVFVFDRVQED
jgi:hypothetical protein